MLFNLGSSRPQFQLAISVVGLMFNVLAEGLEFNVTALFEQFYSDNHICST